jgi:hypothetical protein
MPEYGTENDIKLEQYKEIIRKLEKIETIEKIMDEYCSLSNSDDMHYIWNEFYDHLSCMGTELIKDGNKLLKELGL